QARLQQRVASLPQVGIVFGGHPEQQDGESGQSGDVVGAGQPDHGVYLLFASELIGSERHQGGQMSPARMTDEHDGTDIDSGFQGFSSALSYRTRDVVEGERIA